jgi:hypothetical protein
MILPGSAIPGLAFAFLLALAGCQARPAVSYRGDVYPVLERNCLACHTAPDGPGYRMTGLSLETYETLMAGTRYGPVVVPGDSVRSILIMLVEGRADRSMRMPHDSDAPLADAEIGILRRWVRQGALDN